MSKQSAARKPKTKKTTEKPRTSGSALSPDANDRTRGRKPLSRSHRYKFHFIIPSFAGKRNHEGERHPYGVINLAKCLDSINAQTDRDCSITIVNDGNSVEMRDLVLQFQDNMRDVPIKYLQAPYRGERGGHESVNLALSVLPDNVQFVTILNMDNRIYPTYIADMYHPEYDIVTCMVRMNDIPGITLNGRTFSRRSIDRLNYTIRADIAANVRHKMHMDADCDYVVDCLSMSENGVYHVNYELAEHN